MNTDNPRISVVTHEEIFSETDALPTFSSPAIEFNLHHIPGLSEYFLYFNDDVFLGDVVYPYDLMDLQHGQFFFASWSVPECNERCGDMMHELCVGRYSMLGNGHCDSSCNVQQCGYDMGDCVLAGIGLNKWWL